MVAEYNNEKMACFVQDGQTVGTISYAPNFKPSEHGVLTVSYTHLRAHET